MSFIIVNDVKVLSEFKISGDFQYSQINKLKFETMADTAIEKKEIRVPLLWNGMTSEVIWIAHPPIQESEVKRNPFLRKLGGFLATGIVL